MKKILPCHDRGSKFKRTIFIRPVSVLILVPLLLPLFILVGCGDVHLNLETTVKPSGAVIQKINIEASDKLGDALAESGVVDGFKDEGWQTSTKLELDSFTISAIKRFGQIASLSIPGLSKEMEKLN